MLFSLNMDNNPLTDRSIKVDCVIGGFDHQKSKGQFSSSTTENRRMLACLFYRLIGRDITRQLRPLSGASKVHRAWTNEACLPVRPRPYYFMALTLTSHRGWKGKKKWAITPD